MAGYSQATQEVARPSEVLVVLSAYVTFIQSLGHLVALDTGRLIRGVLLQQTQPRDAAGDQTLTTIYTNWWVTRRDPGVWPWGVVGLGDSDLMSPGTWRPCCAKPAPGPSSWPLPHRPLSRCHGRVSRPSAPPSSPMSQVRDAATLQGWDCHLSQPC